MRHREPAIAAVAGALAAALSMLLSAAPLPAAPDPCQLVTAAEIQSALGRAFGGGTAAGPSRDEETGAQVTGCTRSSGKTVLDIAVAEFPSAATADKAMTDLARRVPDDENEAKMLPATGAGDRSLFGATAIGAHWVAYKGRFMVSVTLAGELGDGGKHRESLRRLANAALGRL